MDLSKFGIILPSGRKLIVSVSRISAVRVSGKDIPVSVGTHFIASIEGGPTRSEVSQEDIRAFYGEAYGIAEKLSRCEGFTPGLFRIESNGPETAKRDDHHVHIIVLNNDELEKNGVTTRRCVDPVLVPTETN